MEAQMFEKLRPYQQEIMPKALEILKNNKRLLAQMPTGLGKTMLATYLTSALKQKTTVLWIAPEKILTQQAKIAVAENLRILGLPVDAINLTTMTRQGLARKLKTGKFANKFDVLVCDEIHMGTSGPSDHDEYELILNSKCYEHLILLSATPWKLDGNLITQDDMDNNRISISLAKASRLGWMHNVKLMRIDTGIQSVIREINTERRIKVDEKDADFARERYEDLNITGLSKEDNLKFKKANVAAALDVYLQSELKDGKLPPTVIYCNSVDNGPDSIVEVAHMLKRDLVKRKLDPSIVGVVYGESKNNETTLRNFKEGKNLDKISVLIVCDMCRAGFDYKELEVVLDFGLNPVNGKDTVQKIGRLTRKHPGKTEAARYYYTRSLGKMLHINGVLKELSTETVREFDNDPSFVESNVADKELRNAAVIETGALLANTGELGDNETMALGLGPVRTLEAAQTEETDAAYEVLEQLSSGMSRKAGSRIVAVELFIERVEEIGKVTYELDIRKTFETAASARDPDGKKALLLEMAKRGDTKPSKASQLYSAYSNYKQSDPDFIEVLYTAAPLWRPAPPILDDELYAIAKQYKSLGEWQKRDRNTYVVCARRTHLFQQIKDQLFPNRRKLKWEELEIWEEARKHKNLWEWQRMSVGSYTAARKNGTIDKIQEVLFTKRRAWTPDAIIAEAKKYKTIFQWQKSCTSYASAQRFPTLMQEIREKFFPDRKQIKAVKCLQNNVIYESLTEAARALVLKSNRISEHLSGKCKHVKGHTFVYVDENGNEITQDQNNVI